MAAQHFNLDFHVRMALDEFHSAYEGLEVLAGLADCDSRHVASVLFVLNRSLRVFIDSSPPARSSKSSLHLVQGD